MRLPKRTLLAMHRARTAWERQRVGAETFLKLLDAAGDEGAACLALAFPIAAPQGCTTDEGPPLSAPGRLWVSGPVNGQAGGCWTASLPGSAACETTTCSFTCGCLAPALQTAGWGNGACVDQATGPVWVES
jgi:hypothetical protein